MKMNKSLFSTLLATVSIAFTQSIFADIETISSNGANVVANQKLLQAQKVRQQQVYKIKQSALKLFRSNYETVKPKLNKLTIDGSTEVSLAELFETTSVEAQKELSQLNGQVALLKGINSNDLLQVRFATQSMRDAWQSGESSLFALEPKGSEKSWTSIKAFDEFGNNFSLSVTETPLQPVLIIDIDHSVALSEGINTMQSYFSKVLTEKTIAAGIDRSESFLADTTSTTVIDSISLQDDMESWLSGNAEIYGLITGIDPFVREPVITPIEMPYLDDDGVTYTPNQIVFFWDTYRFSAADILLLEDDDGTNYQELATQLLSVAESALNQFGEPTIAAIVSITNSIINALPSNIFINDDDYVDVYYTIQENRTYRNHLGASRNAEVDLSPLTIGN